MSSSLFYCDSIGTVTEIFQEAALELTGLLCVFACVCRSFIWRHDVGGMVAQRLALLPPKSFHVSPKFHKQARQVDKSRNVFWLSVGWGSSTLCVTALRWADKPFVFCIACLYFEQVQESIQ